MRELLGIRVGLGIRSEISVPLEVAGKERGVLSAVSTSPEFFSDGDLRFLGTVSRWVGMVAHRADLTENAAAQAAAQGRRTAAEELITVLAHDFRNLLTPLRGRLDLMGRRAAREGQDRYRSDAEELVRSVDRLDRLVRDLLDTARLNQGLFELACEPVDLVELARTTVAELAAPQGAVQVQAPLDEVVVSADSSRLRQVFENLLSNALKVQPEGEPVLLVLDSIDAWATVTIADRGPGIAPEILPHLFERFSAGSGSMGVGLGLYLARGITDAHGGSLEVDSRPGDGARLIVRLPLERGHIDAPLTPRVRERRGLQLVASTNGSHTSA
jgi:signal transduction histidine kinase